MNAFLNLGSDSPAAPASQSEAAKQRLLAVRGEPLAVVAWHRPLFLHYELDPGAVRQQLPRAFELELWQGRAIVSLVALTKRQFRPAESAPLWARLLPWLNEQRFFNVRTYVRHGDESGVFFFWSWLSRPWRLPLPDRPLGVTCAFADSSYQHRHESGELRGVVAAQLGRERFEYEAQFSPEKAWAACPAGSLAEFALERYTGYFWHGGSSRVFRAWHPPWPQTIVEAVIKETGLLARRFPWLVQARLIEANYSPGFDDVWIGRPHTLGAARPSRRPRNHHGASAFFEMP